MVINDFFKKTASVEAYWKFYMYLFENYYDLKLTRAKIAKEMKKSNALVSSIVTKLSSLNLVIMSYNPDIRGTSKYSVNFQFVDIISLLANELNYDEQRIEELIMIFEEWMNTKELQFNFQNVKNSSFYTLFNDPLVNNIAKNVPILFFSTLYSTLIYSLFYIDPETQILDVSSISPYPRKVLLFSARLFIKTLTEIGKYLTDRFLTSHARMFIKKYLTSDKSIVSIINSVQNQLLEFEEEELQIVMSSISNIIEEPSFWFVDTEWLRINTTLEPNIIENLDKNAPLLIELPLKNGNTHKIQVSAILRESSKVEKYIVDYDTSPTGD